MHNNLTAKTAGDTHDPAPQPARQPSLWIGIDISKLTADAAIHLPGGRTAEAKFARTADGMAALASWARTAAGHTAPLRAIMEATGNYSTEAAAWLSAAAPELAPAIVNPLHASKFAASFGLRNKTDRSDARMLARMGTERQPVPYEPLTPRRAELRALVRERRELVCEQTRLKNRMSEGTVSRFILKERTRQLTGLAGTIERMEKEILRVAAGDPALKADMARLQTIPGVGPVTAVTVLAELGDLRRFASGRQLAAFAGVSPRVHQSGTSVQGRTRMCKQGNPSVRAVLYMSAVTSARMAKGMKGVYDRLIENGKAPMSALGALMRRQLLLMRTLLVNGVDYKAPAGTAGPVSQPAECEETPTVNAKKLPESTPGRTTKKPASKPAVPVNNPVENPVEKPKKAPRKRPKKEKKNLA